MSKQTTGELIIVQSLPVLPLKNATLFPLSFMPLTVGRPRSIAAVEAALASEQKELAVIAQKDMTTDDPGIEGLYRFGTKAVIKRMAPGDDAMQLIVQGMVRIELIEAEATEPFVLAKVQNAELPPAPELGEDKTTELEAHRRAVLDLVSRMLELGHGPRAEQLMQTLTATEESDRAGLFVGLTVATRHGKRTVAARSQ